MYKDLMILFKDPILANPTVRKVCCIFDNEKTFSEHQNFQ